MNMQAILKQAQAMQKDMMKAKEEIDGMTFEGHSALVTVTVSGTKEVKKVEILNKSDLEKDDLEVLEDMMLIAANEAFAQVDKVTEEKMGKYTSAMPGLF